MTAPRLAQTPAALDHAVSTPLHVQLATNLRERIEHGEWKPGERIPSENELSRTYGISRMTTRHVLAQLVNEQRLFRVPGKGTFVTHRPIGALPLSYIGIREQLERVDDPTTRLLSNETIPADAKVAQRLRIPPDEPVHRLRQLRFVANQPFSLHTSYVPTTLVADLADDLVNRPLCVILDNDHGLRMSKVIETLQCVLPSPEEAKLLRTRRTTLLLLLQQEIADPVGVRFEYSQILFRGDKTRLQFQYEPGRTTTDDQETQPH
ncbi:MAG TPA: GntR family transcriptional regulator [Nakamurella sp.]